MHALKQNADGNKLWTLISSLLYVTQSFKNLFHKLGRPEKQRTFIDFLPDWSTLQVLVVEIIASLYSPHII